MKPKKLHLGTEKWKIVPWHRYSEVDVYSYFVEDEQGNEICQVYGEEEENRLQAEQIALLPEAISLLFSTSIAIGVCTTDPSDQDILSPEERKGLLKGQQKMIQEFIAKITPV